MPENNKNIDIILSGLTPLEESKKFATVTPVTPEEAERIIDEVTDRILMDTLGVVPKKKQEEKQKEE